MAEASISKILACRYLKLETGSVCWPLLVTVTVWFERAHLELVKNPSFVRSVGTSSRWQRRFWANTFCRCANTSLGVGAKQYSRVGNVVQPDTSYENTTANIVSGQKWSVCDRLFCVVYSGRRWCENSITSISRRAYGSCLTPTRYSIPHL